MANKKISELTAITTLAGTDVFPVVDVSASTTNKVSVSDLLRNTPDGTADAPSIANSGDQDTGIFFPAANSVGVSTAGVQQLVIDSSGNVGIGTSSPASLLHLKSNTPYIRFEDDNDNQDWQIEARAFFGIYDVTDSTFRFAVDGDGNVGIGTTSTGAVVSGMPTLHLASTTAGRSGAIRWKNTGETNKAVAYWFGTEFQIGTETSHPLKFTTADTEQMRIDSSGNVLFAKTTTGLQNDGFEIGAVGGGRQLSLTQSGNGVPAMYINHRYGAGTQSAIQFYFGTSHVGSINVTSTATAYVTSSDYRLKENVVDLDGAITRVKQLQPRRFNFIVDADTTVDGFLAHEAQAVVPEAVTGTHDEVDNDNNPVYQGIDQSKLVPLLTAALQEAIAEIETLKTKVAALEAG